MSKSRLKVAESRLINKSKGFAAKLSDSSETQQEDEVETSVTVKPTDLLEFVPWAIQHLGLTCYVTLKREVLVEPVKATAAATARRERSSVPVAKQSSPMLTVMENNITDPVVINVVFTTTEKVDFLKFKQCKAVPHELLCLINLIIKFHPTLRGISFDRGVDGLCIYELRKMLLISNITEVYLENANVKEQNYDLLLDTGTLKVLSLARCGVGDSVVEKLAEKLEGRSPASMMLSALNLSTNKLTNKSAQVLARVLRTNRKLSYLNLSGNTITTEGGVAILETLKRYAMSVEEIYAYRRAKREYLLNHEALRHKFASKIEKKDVKTAPGARRKNTLDNNVDNLLQPNLFVHPHADSDVHDGYRFANGNNILAYLNLSYNNLMFQFVEVLLDVLMFQQAMDRRPRGLATVCMDGNPLPVHCPEYDLICTILNPIPTTNVKSKRN